MIHPIELDLIEYPKPFEDRRGVVILNGRAMDVVERDTLRPVRGHRGWLWLDGEMLLKPLDEPLFTPDHVQAGKDYLVLVYEVPAALRLDKDPYR